MSRSATERAHEWGKWRGRHEVSSLQIVGYEHQCGAANLLDPHDDGSEVACSGCRFEIGEPLTQCEPLYRLQDSETRS